MCTLYADDSLVVVDKPAGLLSVPGRGADKQDCAVARVQATWPDALTVHRLDMATSGLLLLARGAVIQRQLSAAFELRQVDKRYVAIVDGLLADDAGEIDAPLAADWPQRPRQRIDHEHGKASLTRWRVLSRDAAAQRTRLELEPLTGRSHQLRVHLASLGHTIVGDTLYGGSPAPRLLLHASELAFVHPQTAQPQLHRSAAPF